MKRVIVILISVFIVGALYGQTNNIFKYPLTVGSTSPAVNGQITLKGGTSGTAVIRVPAVAGTGIIFQLPTTNGSSGYVLRTDGSGVLSWVAQGTGITASDTASMLSKYARKLSPTFTGTVVLPTTTSIGSVSDTEIGYVNGVTSAIQTQLNNKADTAGQIDLATVFPKLAPDTVQHTASYTVGASDWGTDQHCLRATPIGITIPANLSEWPVGGVMNFYGEGAGIMVFKKSGVTFISDIDSIATSRKGQAVTIKKIATNKYFLVGPLTD